MKPARNVAASVRYRLLDRAREDKRPFNELLQYYAMERFLFRLSRSAHADCFILKGALMSRAWRSPEFRPTMDIDMLGRTSNDETKILSQIEDILNVSLEPDGLIFVSDSIQSERITEDADYEGIRIRFRGFLDSAKVTLQVDIGFGDSSILDQRNRICLPCWISSRPDSFVTVGKAPLPRNSKPW